ncbi:MAG: FAD-binding protein [Myxococcales bacterium]|nr:FAD-binding protein [Myxococcales bacterium]
MVAALELLDAGKRVVLLDRASRDRFGGLARWSFGGIFFVDSPEQRKNGIKESVRDRRRRRVHDDRDGNSHGHDERVRSHFLRVSRWRAGADLAIPVDSIERQNLHHYRESTCRRRSNRHRSGICKYGERFGGGPSAQCLPSPKRGAP